MQLDTLSKKYVSEETEFLNELNSKLETSASQQKEIAKHESIAERRDDPNAASEDKKIWDGF